MSASPPDPNWLLEILKITIPVVLGALIWAGQTLAQRAWTEYERRRDAYVDVVRLIDSLFEGGDVGDRPEYLRAVRKVWLVGSDQVVKAINGLSLITRRSGATNEQQEQAYRDCLSVMRQDLR